MEMRIESCTDLSVDDFYFSALIDESDDQILPVSDSKYAHELQFQETLMSSLVASKSHPPIQTDPDHNSWRPVLPREQVDVSERTISEGLVPESEKFYCPYKDCSAMMVIDSGEGAEEIRESECPVCHRLFCARCYVTWHAGVGCEEYQRMNEDERESEDPMVRELANQKNWDRCPNCKFCVERTEGCPHITCSAPLVFGSSNGASSSSIFSFTTATSSALSQPVFGDPSCGRSFSLGTAGGDKSNRKIMRVKRRRKK